MNKQEWINWILERDWRCLLVSYRNIDKVFDDTYCASMKNKLADRNSDNFLEGKKYKVCFYDLLINTQSNDSKNFHVYKSMLCYIDACIGYALDVIGIDRSSMKSFVKDLFMVNGWDYLNKVAELASLIYLHKKHANEWRLISVEHKFQTEDGKIKENGKDVDILFKDIDGRDVLIDILSVHNAGKLNSKIQKKVRKKFGSENTSQQYIQPFLWSDLNSTIEKIQNLTPRSDNSLPVLTLRQQRSIDGDVYFDCCEISDMANYAK